MIINQLKENNSWDYNQIVFLTGLKKSYEKGGPINTFFLMVHEN